MCCIILTISNSNLILQNTCAIYHWASKIFYDFMIFLEMKDTVMHVRTCMSHIEDAFHSLYSNLPNYLMNLGNCK
jgi:hypothetical protein